MARPTKRQQALKALEELGIKLEDLIDIPEPTVIEKEVVKEVIKEVEREESIDIDDNVKVEVKSNVGGVVVLKTKGTNLFKKIDGYGSSARIKYSDLDSLLGEHPKTIRNGTIYISRVITKGVSLEDLIEDIGLDDLYFSEDKVSPDQIEKLFTNEIDAGKFTQLVNNSLELAPTILEAGYQLYNNGKFNDNAKMNTLRQVFRDPQLFS